MELEVKVDKVMDIEYDMQGNLYFGNYKMTQRSALNIAYALLDSLNLDYSILEIVEDELNGKEYEEI